MAIVFGENSSVITEGLANRGHSHFVISEVIKLSVVIELNRFLGVTK